MKPRKKKCRSCGERFQPWNSMQVACSPKCALDVGKKDVEKKERKAHKEAKERIKSRSDWLREAQQAFNAYIRARDEGKPCISCDKPDNGQHQRHASHYRSVGACTQLRFSTFNVHASCSTCNCILSGNLLEFRIRLIKKLGEDRVIWLESQNEITRYDIEYLKRLKRIFNKRARHIKKINQMKSCR